jgi:bidirectional [NiFe] hydrogenase diaphorase subunit
VSASAGPPQPRASAYVCQAVSCLSAGAEEIATNLALEVAEAGLNDVTVKRVGCIGLCAAGPLVKVPQTGQLFDNVRPDAIEPIVSALATASPDAKVEASHPFFARQLRVVTENSGVVDPESIDDYVAHGGYAALHKAITTLTPAEVRDELVRSGLRGRGGAGYPTGLKWNTVAKAIGSPKYAICNADEGDPGAFMDRTVLESDPHRVIEGLAIAAYAVGASHAYVYCRGEYPLVIRRVRKAIEQAEAAGYLGQTVAGTPYALRIQVRLGAGAYVCGEETALIASVEGKRGQPIPRPPYPAVSGLWDRPTLINNVETLANVPSIIDRGADWFAGIGTGTSKGTKVFALAGHVARTGLVEVPMGMTLREIVFDIGGGMLEGHTFKAVQTGGPSGGCIPAQFLDMPVDYESLLEIGTYMGSGGMIVMDDSTCMVDVAKFFMHFCRDESCGKCVPCRVGTSQLYILLDRISRGEAQLTDIDQLEKLCGMVRRTSLCGLGQGAPNPILSTLRYFRDEYEAHVVERVCPAGVCSIQREAVPA